MSFVFVLITIFLLLAVKPRGISRVVAITFAVCGLAYALSRVDWTEPPSGLGLTNGEPLDESAIAKRHLAEATKNRVSVSDAAADDKTDDARKGSEAKDEIASNYAWRRWPSNSPYCSDTLAKSFNGFFTEGEATYYVSKCAHSSAGDVQALVYAGSQNGSTAVEIVSTLIHFANAAHLHPSEFARCLEASRVKPKDSSGAWRDMTVLLLEYSRRSQGLHSCVRKLASP